MEIVTVDIGVKKSVFLAMFLMFNFFLKQNAEVMQKFFFFGNLI